MICSTIPKGNSCLKNCLGEERVGGQPKRAAQLRET